jgi:hypothetical protein
MLVIPLVVSLALLLFGGWFMVVWLLRTVRVQEARQSGTAVDGSVPNPAADGRPARRGVLRAPTVRYEFDGRQREAALLNWHRPLAVGTAVPHKVDLRDPDQPVAADRDDCGMLIVVNTLIAAIGLAGFAVTLIYLS